MEDFFLYFEDNQKRLKEYKKRLPIGVFGSFDERNRTILTDLCEFLRDEGYIAKISLDLENENPKNEGEPEDEYNVRMSQLLMDSSNILIFLFFSRVDGDPEINQSTSMEFEHACDQGRNVDILTLFENGFQAGGYFRGRRSAIAQSYVWEKFTRASFPFVEIKQYCFDKIHQILIGE